jgi:hypothetical protein
MSSLQARRRSSRLFGQEYLELRRKVGLEKACVHGDDPIVIDHDRPPPIERRGGAFNRKAHFYPFEAMRPGDSFWVPGQTKCTNGAVTKFAKRTGWRFTTRAEAQDGRVNSKVSPSLRGIRVWRLE